MTEIEYNSLRNKNGKVTSPQPRPKGWAYKRMMSNLKLRGK